MEKTDLLIQAADVNLQEKLERLLEGRSEELGLKNDWKEMVKMVALLTKRPRRRNKNVVSDAKTMVLLWHIHMVSHKLQIQMWRI